MPDLPHEPGVGSVWFDTECSRLVRVVALDDTHVTVHVITRAGEKLRTSRIRRKAWGRRFVAEPAAARWTGPDQVVHDLYQADVDLLAAVGRGEVSTDSRFPDRVWVGPASLPLRLPTEALARLTDLGAVAADEPQPHEPMRVGQSLPYEITGYRLTAAAAALLADPDDVARCRVCGCTEDAPCPGGCCWVPDPTMRGDLCSACPADANPTVPTGAGKEE